MTTPNAPSLLDELLSGLIDHTEDTDEPADGPHSGAALAGSGPGSMIPRACTLRSFASMWLVNRLAGARALMQINFCASCMTDNSANRYFGTTMQL